MSSKTRSVYFNNSSILSVFFLLNVTPEVSRAVCIFRVLAVLKSSVTKSICNNGSPPVTVIPPF